MAAEVSPSGELTALDESYSHQLVTPRAVTCYTDPRWQDRTYYLLFTDGGLMLNLGRSVWRHEGVRRGFVALTDGVTQAVIRSERPFDPHGDPDDPTVGEVSVFVEEPLRRTRLVVQGSDAIAADLTWTARFPPVATTPQRVEQDGVVVTDYMNFFQPGRFDGWVELLGKRHEVSGRFGFRDRGWGLRKHEGAPRRGLVLSAFCELPDESLYLIVFETASTKRVLTNGWRIDGTGVDRAVEIDHDLNFEELLLVGGRIRVKFASGQERHIDVTRRQRLFLAGVGYSSDPRFTAAGAECFDVSSSAVREMLRGQTDHGCDFVVDGVAGHGYVETGLGIHARYRPE